MDLSQGPTRQQILVLLKQTGGMTVDQLSSALNISAMGIRQHLALLEKDGLIEETKKRGEMGRPAHVYSLSRKGDETFPRNYETLAIFLLETLLDTDGGKKVNELFRRRMEQIYETLAPHLKGRELAQMIADLAEILREQGYMATYEETPEGFYLREYNCTMARVSERFPVACDYELELFRRLIGPAVRRRNCITSGAPCCLYFIPRDMAGLMEQAAD